MQPETNDIIPSPEVQAQAADLIEAAEAELEYQPVEGTHTPGKKPDYYRTLPDGTIVAISRTEYKRGMHDQFTVKHRRLPCGHKLVAGQPPRHRNCDLCWMTFFNVHGELTQAVEEAYQSQGKEVGAELIKQLRGVKFLKYFLRFLSTVALYKEQMEASLETQPVG